MGCSTKKAAVLSILIAVVVLAVSGGQGDQVLVDQAAMLRGEKWFRSSGWRAEPTFFFSAPLDKPEISLTFSRLTMAGIEHRHAAVGFFPLLTDSPA